MRSLAHTVPSRLVIPLGVWFSFNFGNTLFNLLFRFGSDSHSRCHSSCSKSLILFPKSEATIVFETSFSDRASFAASSASSLPFMPIWDVLLMYVCLCKCIANGPRCTEMCRLTSCSNMQPDEEPEAVVDNEDDFDYESDGEDERY